MRKILKSEFEIHPVGQGFFYSGKIETNNKNWNLVYDCGATGSNQKLNREINNLINSGFFTNNILDILVISHFDSDHINGLPKLLENVTVKNLFIPYYSEMDLLFVNFLFEILDSNTKIERTILVQGGELSKSGLEREVREFDGNKEFDSDLDIELGDFSSDFFEIDSNLNTNLFRLKNNKVGLQKEWEMDFYNLPLDNEEIKQFEQKIKNELIHEIEMKNNVVLSEEDKESLKNLVKFKGIGEIQEYLKSVVNKSSKEDLSNNSSLCLYHSPSRVIKRNHYSTFLMKESIFNIVEFSSRITSIKNGTLLTGDINLIFTKSLKNFPAKRWKNFNDYYSNKLGTIKFFFIPHHGSKKNWRKELLDYGKGGYFISSSGINNTHNHPNTEVIDDIVRNNGCLFLVNQESKIEYCINTFL
ncbi:hypothetical protein [Planococcus chinensis]|uniref:MBL fold metallo-hydrolase n=1 Tax=Planococcus chinensis TaxID=272917 RepID=A0ABW4QIE1_9BACL